MRKDDAQLRNDHDAMRNKAGYHDFSHQMLKAEGPDAGAFMDKMFVNNISGADVGQGKYTSMLNEKGQIIDDVIIFRMEDNMYWISTLFIDDMLSWFDSHSSGFDVTFKDIKDVTTMYAVQGPNSRAILNKIVDDNLDSVKFARIIDTKMGDVPVKVARFGFTGELGFELYFAPEHADFVESKLEEAGKPLGIKKIETDVYLTSLPVEKGLKTMGEYSGIDPVEAGLGWTVDWDSDFVGKEAVKESKEKGPKRSIVGFTVEDDNADVEKKAEIKKNGDVVGKVTNYTYGFTAEKSIGFALIDNAKAQKGDKVTIDGVEATLTSDVFV